MKFNTWSKRKKIFFVIGLVILIFTTSFLLDLFYWYQVDFNQPKKHLDVGLIDANEKARILVITDVGNEVDDQQSLVRLFLYLDNFDLEGILTSTSTWMRYQTKKYLVEDIINAYADARENLILQSGNYFPTKEQLFALVKDCKPIYGMSAVGEGMDSEGSNWIISRVDAYDTRPLWISVWGGINPLAQALWKVKSTRSEAEINKFISNLRIYTISDQDSSGKWIRDTFPGIFYIVNPCDPDNMIKSTLAYKYATWTGISGEKHYGFDKDGPNSSLISDSWVRTNIQQNHGSLGRIYPSTKYIMEGDSPAFLNLIDNGLRSVQSPTFGGWGGRYEKYLLTLDQHIIYTSSPDSVEINYQMYNSSQVTIWRWREAYQNDMAARMDWASNANYSAVNHPPRVSIQGELNRIIYNTNEIILNALGTNDPDGDTVEYRWWWYKEAGDYSGDLNIADPSAIQTSLLFRDLACSGTVHIILEVKDDDVPCLYRYARIVINVNPDQT